MLKKLRVKFVLVNMTIVTIMLAAIFTLFYYSAGRNLELESYQRIRELSEMVEEEREKSPQSEPVPHSHLEDNKRFPYLYISVNQLGEITSTDGFFAENTEDELIESLLESALNSRNGKGTIKEHRLRFIRQDTQSGQEIIFLDMSFEQFTLHQLLEAFALVGAAAFLGFLVISILLARWAVHPVEKAWNQQKQFVADASHELKTPLTVILTDAELLHSPDCNESERSNLSGSIITMSEQMRGLVESLLELARVDNAAKSKFKQSASLSEIVSESAMIFEPVFFEKDLLFEYDIAPDISIKGDPTHLKQLADILLDNAAKYASPCGRTVLTLKKRPRPYRRSVCVLEVANEGEPIREEDLQNLFKRFYRADKARSMNHSYGLGLSIAKSVVEEHGGRIRAVSENGWNRFIAELPIK